MFDQTNEENSKEVLMREDLLSTAVNFLLNPDVRKRSDGSKIGFLKKKGLTNEEISEALRRAELNQEPDQLSRYYPVHPPPPLPYVRNTFWSRLNGFSSSLIIFGVAIYGLRHLYKKFIKPLLFDEEGDENYTPSHIKQITENLAALTTTLQSLQVTVSKHNEEIIKLLQVEGIDCTPTPILLEDLKRDVNSLKSILISRHQFPAVPQIQSAKATIPSWQMNSEKNQSADEEREKLVSAAYPKPENSDLEIETLLNVDLNGDSDEAADTIKQ